MENFNTWRHEPVSAVPCCSLHTYGTADPTRLACDQTRHSAVDLVQVANSAWRMIKISFINGTPKSRRLVSRLRTCYLSKSRVP